VNIGLADRKRTHDFWLPAQPACYLNLLAQSDRRPLIKTWGHHDNSGTAFLARHQAPGGIGEPKHASDAHQGPPRAKPGGRPFVIFTIISLSTGTREAGLGHSL
jgi:hypothetical protein